MDNRGALLGWEAVGRLDLSGGFCTGALIARDLVLTAAHCVYDPDTRQPRDPQDLVFRAGYHRGQQITARKVLRYVTPAPYQSTPRSKQALAHDVAVLKLEAPVSSAEASPFRLVETPQSGTHVSVVSYGRGREEVLSREPDCAVTQRYRGGVIGFDCDVTFGSSGAPVFVREDGRLRILTLVSSGGSSGEAYGPGLSALLPDLLAELRREDARPIVSNGARRITVGAEHGRTGARFVRP